ncbi:UNVERIFIED_CONTAM: Integral membrane protein dgcr2/IDD [Gekko kuhli]
MAMRASTSGKEGAMEERRQWLTGEPGLGQDKQERADAADPVTWSSMTSMFLSMVSWNTWNNCCVCSHLQESSHPVAIGLPMLLDGVLLCFFLSFAMTEYDFTGDQRNYHGKENVDSRHNRGRGGDTTRFHTVNVAQPVRFSRKCPSGWHHYDGTASCYRVYLNGENYWDAVQTCQRVNGSLATFTTDLELKFILQQEWDSEEKAFGRKDQRRLWVGYQFVITNRNHSLEGHWEVTYKGSSEVFLPPKPTFSSAVSENENILCAQFQCSHFPTLRHRGFHSWYAENCYEKSSFLCKRSQTCVDIKDNIVDEGYYFTPKGDDPCLSCTCHKGEPEMCVAALCERPQGCQQYLKDPKECCRFTCLDPGCTENIYRITDNFVLASESLYG